MSTPPLPAGYALDQPQAMPPLPAGYKLDSANTTSTPTEQPGILDREIPLTSYGNATLSGLQSVGRGVRDAVQGVGQMVMHPIDTAKGIAQLPAQAAQVPAAVSDINQSPDPTGTYAKVAQETAGQGAGQALVALGTEGLVKGASAAKNALPSTARAGAAFRDLKATVGDVPINTAKVGDSALELYEQAQRGATMPTAVNKLIRRMTAPDAEPLTYTEAKDFQSNISNLSVNEKLSLKPNQVRLVGKLNADLKAALEDAADTQGKGQQFVQAMHEYRNAMRLRGFTDEAINNAWKLALKGAGVYGAAKLIGLETAPDH